ncbi:MAG: hypothetical protein M1823_005374 [Watsoniomyces obsoletus]|nr:MAG: hypothetical protein M1823_005374 [Watsoniomyces obsoletus]
MPLATAFPTSSSRQYHHVDVGAGGNQIFQPNQLNASIGDIVRFNFLAVNHSLTQSDFLLPCSSSGGFETGFHQFNPLNTSGQFVVSLEVRTTRSQWFFCAQKTPVSHCRAGMLFGLNPASQMAQFLQNAQSAAGTGASSGNGSVPASSGTSTSNTTSREALELFPPGNTTGPLVLPLATGSAVSAFGSVGNSTPSSILNQTSFNVGPSIQVEQWTNWLFWGGLVLVTHPLLLS